MTYQPSTEPCRFTCNARRDGTGPYVCRAKCEKDYRSKHACRCQLHDNPREWGDSN